MKPSHRPTSERPASERPTTWQLKSRSLTIRRSPLVMGILNVTPDSFSDGGKHRDVTIAIESALAMQAAGADIIDIGGESTRPYSDPVAASEELDRVMPVIDGLRGRLSVPISIDTSKSVVASAAIDGGAEIINDVTGLEGDPAMAALAASTRVGVCVMHMRGTPQTMQDDPAYDDVVADIHRYLAARLQFCVEAGIDRNRVCLDPGIGFGKTHEHNLELIAATDRFGDLGCPILIGHSRKGFIRKLIGAAKDEPVAVTDMMAATLGVTLAVAAAGASVVRVHDVRETVLALRLFETAGGGWSPGGDRT